MAITPDQARAELRRRAAVAELRRRETSILLSRSSTVSSDPNDIAAPIYNEPGPKADAAAPTPETTWGAEVYHALGRGGIKAAAAGPGALGTLLDVGSRSATMPGGWGQAMSAAEQAKTQESVRNLRKKATEIYRTADVPSLAPRKGGVLGKVVNIGGEAIPALAVSAVSSVLGPAGPILVGTATGGEVAAQEALKEGATTEQSEIERWLVGPVNGALNLLQVGGILKVGKKSLAGMVEAARTKMWGALAKEGAKLTAGQLISAAAEGLEEGLQQATQIGAGAIHGAPVLTKEHFTEVLTAAAAGAGVGGAAKAVVGTGRGLTELNAEIGKAKTRGRMERIEAAATPEQRAEAATQRAIPQETQTERIAAEVGRYQQGHPVVSQETPKGAAQEPLPISDASQKTTVVSDNVPPAEPPTVAGPPRTPGSVSYAATDTGRSDLGLSPRPETVPQSWAESRQKAIDGGLNNPITAARRAQEIVDDPRPLLPEESAGFGMVLEEAKATYRRAEKLTAELSDSDPRYAEAAKQGQEARELYDHISQATMAAGAPGGRSQQARQMVMDALTDNTSVPSVLSRARIEKGRDLTPVEVAEATETVHKLATATDNADKVQRIASRRQAGKVLRAGRRKGSRYDRMTEAEKDVELQDLLKEAGDTPDAAALYNMAMNLGSRPGVRTIGDIVTRLQEHFPSMNEFSLSDALVTAMERKVRATSQTEQVLKTIRKEARGNKGLRTLIDDILYRIKGGEGPEDKRLLRKPETDTIQALKEVRDFYAKEFANSEPAQKAKWEKLIAGMEARIKSGDFAPREKASSPPMSDTIRELHDHYLELQAEHRRLVKEHREGGAGALIKLNKEIAVLEDKIKRGAYNKPARGRPREFEELDALRSRKKDAQEALARIRRNRKTLNDLRAKERELQKHLNEGTLPPGKAPKIGPEADPIVIKMREAVGILQGRLRESEPAQQAKIQRRIDFLTARIAAGDFLPKPKQVAYEPSRRVLEMQYEAARLNSEIRRQISRQERMSGLSIAAEPLRIVMALKSSFDLSGLGNQGGWALLSHPLRTLRRVPEALNAFASEKETWIINERIQKRENASLYFRDKLALVEAAGHVAFTHGEEQYRSNLAEYIPGIKGSNRSFATLLNLIRADSYDSLAKSFAEAGGPTRIEGLAIADFVNMMTGRSSIRGYEQTVAAVNGIFWAPRRAISRFQVITTLGGAVEWGWPSQPGQWKHPLVHLRGTGTTRKLFAGEIGRYMAGLATVYTLGALAGGELEGDPRSTNFGKIKFGNTRIDPLSGLSQTLVFLSRFATLSTKDTEGEIAPLAGEDLPYTARTLGDVGWDFLSGKVTPGLGIGWSILSGETRFDGPTTPWTVLKGSLAPIAWEDVYKVMVDKGVSRGTALSMLGLLGVGVQVYGDELTRAEYEEYYNK